MEESNVISKKWEIRKLSTVISITKGKKPRNLEANNTRYLIPYINIEAFEKGVFTQYTDGIDARTCDVTDILMVWDGARCGLVGKGVSGAIGSTLAKLDFQDFIPSFVFYFLQSHYDTINKNPRGIGIPHVDPNIFWNIQIPLPPLAEQERIVAKIEALFSQLEAGGAALRRAQAGLKRYKASLLKAACEGRLVPQDPSDEPAEVVLRRLGKSPLQDASLPSLPRGWCWVTMSEVADINLREPFIRNLPDDLLVTFVPMAAVNAEMGIIVKPEQRPLKEVRKGFTSFLEGDVIFAKITPCMENGKAAIVPKLHNGVGFGSTEFHVLRPRENVISQWLFYFVRRESFRVDAKASFTGTAGQLRVPAKFLASYPFPLPPLAEQERIVAELEQRLTVVAQVEAAIQAALTRSARLRQAILKRAFRGEL